MPVADVPIIEQIAREVYERLSTLVDGFDERSPVVEVIRPLRNGGWTPQHQQIVLVQDQMERATDIDYPGNPPAIGWRVRFNIRCHIMPSELSDVALDEWINFILAGVFRVITDPLDWQNFGDLAIHADWESQEKIAHDGGFAGINQPLTVTFRVAEDDPYTVR